MSEETGSKSSCEMMSDRCQYCSGEKRLICPSTALSYKGDFYPGMDIWVEPGRLYVEVRPDTYEPCFMEDEVKINFCPICGRKFGDA